MTAWRWPICLFWCWFLQWQWRPPHVDTTPATTRVMIIHRGMVFFLPFSVVSELNWRKAVLVWGFLMLPWESHLLECSSE